MPHMKQAPKVMLLLGLAVAAPAAVIASNGSAPILAAA
jgi:hypothetical protein